QAVGLPSPNWLGDPAYTKLALVMIAQLGAGQWALVFLAGLRGIPIELYESAEIDGAGAFRKFRSITLPLMTPVILYDLIIGLSAPSGRRWRRVVTRSVLPRVVLILGCLVFLAPFYWMVISALKTNAELTQFPPSLIPGAWAWQNFVDAVNYIPFGLYTLNSL